MVPIDPKKAPEKARMSPEKARLSRKDFCPIFSENLSCKPSFMCPRLGLCQSKSVLPVQKSTGGPEGGVQIWWLEKKRHQNLSPGFGQGRFEMGGAFRKGF